MGGYYTCFGDDWPPGKVPKCKYCRSVATWELWAHNGQVLLCDDARCHTAYIADEGFCVEYNEGPVQRDVYSAWLATMAVADPDGSDKWRLDASQAQAAWPGAEQRLPAAPSPVSVQAFAAWAKKKAARERPVAPRLTKSGTERLAGKVNRVAATRTPGF